MSHGVKEEGTAYSVTISWRNKHALHYR